MTIVRSRVYAPTLWTCPQCGTRVRTHINTYPVECRHKSHHRDIIVMTPEREEQTNG